MRDYLRRCVAEYVATLLAKHGGNVRAAAKEAGRNRTDFYKVMRRAGIEPARTGSGHRGEWRALQ